MNAIEITLCNPEILTILFCESDEEKSQILTHLTDSIREYQSLNTNESGPNIVKSLPSEKVYSMISNKNQEPIDEEDENENNNTNNNNINNNDTNTNIINNDTNLDNQISQINVNEDSEEEGEGEGEEYEDDYEEFETNQNNNGLSDDIIKSFPVSKIKNVKKLSEDKKKCSICLEKFKNNDNTMIIPCTHLFHPNCIQKWMKIKNICPICKYKIY